MMGDLLPLGVHFGLDFKRYLEDPGLGSGDIRLLARSPSDWWWQSRFNPKRPKRPDQKHFILGQALHKLVLEGRQAFDATFMRGPDVNDALSSGQKGVQTKKFNYEAAQAGLVALKADEHDQILGWAEAIMRNPYLKGAFHDGHSEVSVFWEREGVRLKGRFDYLKVGPRHGTMLAANGDLKTVENTHDKPFRKACADSIATYGYDAQASHYIDGLSRLPAIIRRADIYWQTVPTVTSKDHEWLERFLAKNIRYAWQWVFVQKSGFPLTWSCSMTPGLDGRAGSQIFEDGAATVNRGLTNYVNYMEKFGETKMWEEFEPPEELMPEYMPAWWRA